MTAAAVPETWERLSTMSGAFVERNVENLNDFAVHGPRIDVIHVPAWSLRYEVEAGHFGSDEQIQSALNLYGWGLSAGIEIGKRDARAEIRRALGIEERKL